MNENANENMPVYDWDNAVIYITERCGLERNEVEEVLLLEEDYMRSVGIILESDGE